MLGMKIVPSEGAFRLEKVYRVVRASPKMKRRKNWRVGWVEVGKPCAYQVGNVLYMHPILIEEFRQTVS